MDTVMPIGKILFLAFLLIPVAEIYVLIQVGGVLGVLPTIVLIVFTAVLGSMLIRSQGLATLAGVRTSMERGEVPALQLMEGMCLLVAGALLLTPGFVTDSVGFILLVPPLRRAMILSVLERGVLRTVAGPAASVNSAPFATHQQPTTGTKSRGSSDSQQQGSAKTGARTGQIFDGEFKREDP
ncbi:MAG: UPF0716 protein FxsA [Gammaproteobacteria bacterium]|jgi:UPF0716 protein FxsA